MSATDSDGSTSLQSAVSAVVASPQALGQLPLEPTITANSTTDAFTASPAAGVPNGTGASETAKLQLAAHNVISRSYAQRALTLTGRLLNSAGSPITGATLDVTAQVLGSDSDLIIAHASTGPDGSFAAHVPAGPSRLIHIAYRAFSSDPVYSTQAGVKETVTAGVLLQITPRRTGWSGRIVLSGRVQGPMPAQGVVVEMLVHYRGHWEPFRDPRTSRSGRFRMSYQFEGAVGRFPFRAEVLGGQAGFPYATGESTPVDVATN